MAKFNISPASSSGFKMFSATLCTLLIQSVGHAQPVVSGNTITVPDDGWYQFQSAINYQTLCEGVLSCEVPSGRYIVINHSTQKRFDNVNVSTTPTSSGEISVNGNVISWPVGDWYQVQSADYTSVCNGGASCEVSPGVYTVINHSTGERFNGVQVGGGTVTPPSAGGDGINLVGNTITWGGDDYYQIQSSTDYRTICEGGNSCEVSPGNYIVINHTTGTRIDDYVVGAGTPFGGGGGSSPSTPPNLRGSVYSSSEVEIFWDASNDDSLVVGYDIYRDGDRVQQTLDGRSFYESSLAAGTNYEYRVIAIDDQGNESTASVVQLTTQGTAPPNQNNDTVAAAQAPIVDANNQVSWAFGPVDSGLTLNVEPFVQMPLASNGNPARWNDMATLGDRIFVVDEQDGRIYEITNRQVSLWFNIGAAVQSSTGRSLNIDNPFHGGVRGIAFHPDFASNGKLYTTLLEQRPADPTQHVYLSDAAAIDADSVLVEWTVNSDVVDASSYREVFRVGIPEYDHPIKQIAFDPSVSSGSADYGLLYIAHGDGSKESTTAVGGQGNDALGKILRINPLANGAASYSIPGNNPFVGNSSMPDEAYSVGHRNPHHPAFMNDGTLLVTEDGRDNIDEVNLIVAGADYGWSQREGAYVQLGQAGLSTGISTLPANDTDLNFTYPVAQFGHTGNVGAGFTGQALGGGHVIENGSELDGQYFYIDFPKSGEIFHSSIAAIRAANTGGAPVNLTVAKTGRASITFNHDNSDATAALNTTMREVIRSASGYDNGDRVDIRFGQGPDGELYMMNKRNNVVYLVTNSLPVDGGNLGPVGTGKPSSDDGTHGFEVWDTMSTAAQAVTPSDCLLGTAGQTGPFYCFSPFDRRLMRIVNDGGITWQFPLPGDNASNHIEAIDFINGGTVVTTADATPSPDDSAYDISQFNQTGAYIGTVHIIPDIENPNGVDFAGVNLDGLDLIVTPGAVYQNTGSDSSTQPFLNDLYVYGEYYSEIAGADASRLDGWLNEGAFRARLDSRTGATLDTKLFAGKTVDQTLQECSVPGDGNTNRDSCS